MDQRTAFLIQVLEKIGAPLTAAVTLSTPANLTPEGSRQDAQRVAELLNRSVQLGLTLADGMSVRDDEGQADGIRLSLASFASPLIAGHFAAMGKAPTEADLRRYSTSLQAVLTFADTFTPAADTTLRLQNLESGPGDEALISVQIMQAFTPVLMAVSDYAFGKPENKLIQDVGVRILEKAVELRSDLFGKDMPPKQAKQIELYILRALCGLYVSCHLAETRRLGAMDPQSRDAMMATPDAIDQVWKNFNMRAEMLRVLGGRIIFGAESQAGSGSGGGKGYRPPVAAEKPQAPLVAEKPGEKPSEKTAGKPNPMSFFKKSG